MITTSTPNQDFILSKAHIQNGTHLQRNLLNGVFIYSQVLETQFKNPSLTWMHASLCILINSCFWVGFFPFPNKETIHKSAPGQGTSFVLSFKLPEAWIIWILQPSFSFQHYPVVLGKMASILAETAVLVVSLFFFQLIIC